MKTNRIARIFSKKLFKKKTMRCLSIGWQYFMIACIISFDMLLSVLWVFIIHSPSLIEDEPVNGRRLMKCSLGNKKVAGWIFWAIYNTGNVK